MVQIIVPYAYGAYEMALMYIEGYSYIGSNIIRIMVYKITCSS